jgi:molybdopterin-synthase adenylyltransferase
LSNADSHSNTGSQGEAGGPRDRYVRQRDLVPAERLADLTVTIVGVGAIGRQVVLQLAAIGVPKLQIIDFDTVEVENLAPQGYLEADMGRPKVQATAELARRINGGVEIQESPERFRRSMAVGDVLFNCVDSIETRRHIWQAVRDRARFYADTRMSAEVVRVLAAADGPSREHYPTTFFTADQAQSGACTSRSTIYTANIAAGLAVGQFTRWLRGLPVEPDICLNILTSELSCGLPVATAVATGITAAAGRGHGHG